MINAFKVKKWGALILSGMLTSVGFYVGLIYYNFVYALLFLGGGLLVAAVLGNVMLKNPFSSMLEGKGILAINLDSTGIIKPFIVKVSSPYIRGVIDGNFVNDVFDREAIYQLKAPSKASKECDAKFIEGGKLQITLDEDQYNKARFAMFHYPVILWNDQIKSVMTKDFLADGEKVAFAEHGVLYLNRKTEELTSAIRDFGRYVVETIKPKANIFQNKWFWIILVIGLIALGLLFAPQIMNVVKGTVGSASGAVQGVVADKAVIPI